MGFKTVVLHPDSHFGSATESAFRARGCDVLSLREGAALDSLSASINDWHPQIVVTPLFSVPEDFARQLATLCAEHRLPLLAVTGHAIFNGLSNEAPWQEADVPEPQVPEGIAQLGLERLVLAHAKSAVIRLPWVVDDAREPMLYRVAEALLAGGKLMVSDRWRGCVIDTQDVVRVLFAMAQQIICGAENWGIFHLRSSDDCSEAEFADYVRRILRKAGYDNLAEIVTVSEQYRFTSSNGWLAGHRCTNDFGIQMRSWRQGIKTKTLQWLADTSAQNAPDLRREARD